MMTLLAVRKRLATLLAVVVAVALVGCASTQSSGDFSSTPCERCEDECEVLNDVADCVEACLRDCDPGL